MGEEERPERLGDWLWECVGDGGGVAVNAFLCFSTTPSNSPASISVKSNSSIITVKHSSLLSQAAAMLLYILI